MAQIDNYIEAQDLCDDLEATLPFRVKAGFKLRKTMGDKGLQVDEQTWFPVDFAKYSGDEGGIMCGLMTEDDQQFVVSLTHVKIDPEHPLAAEVKEYQQQHIEKLKRSEQGGQKKPKAGRKQKKK